MFWYSPAASQENQIAHFVFRLRVVGDALELEVVKGSETNEGDLYRSSPLPRLESSAQGDLILNDWDGSYRYLPDGQWRKL